MDEFLGSSCSPSLVLEYLGLQVYPVTQVLSSLQGYKSKIGKIANDIVFCQGQILGNKNNS